MPFLSFLAFCLFLFCAATAGAADAASTPAPAIWSGLILATNDSHPSQPPARLRQLAGKLKNVFGYNQFELVGEHSEKMDDPYERWLIPSKDFSLSVRTRTEPGEQYPLRIVLYQNHHRLVEFEPHLNRDSPLFIRGPLYAGGQLVIVLRVVDASEMPARAQRTALVATNPGPAPSSKPRTNATPASVATIPNERIKPAPADRGPIPAAREPIRADHFGPGPGEHPGNLDSKLTRP